MPADRPDARIRIQADGPYVVTGPVTVTRRRIVRSEHGEPMTWQTTHHLEAGERFALCHCGGSSTKPFCDGTHLVNGFDGTETAPTGSYDDRAVSYEGTRVVVRDDRAICEHAGFCGNRLTNVWEMAGGSGTEDSVTRAQMMAMIEHCPSGALTYRITVNDTDVEPELATQIAVTEDGPYFVTGRIPVDRSDGQPLQSRNRMTLCRCGRSSNKPLCDGSHKDAGFHDADVAGGDGATAR